MAKKQKSLWWMYFILGILVLGILLGILFYQKSFVNISSNDLKAAYDITPAANVSWCKERLFSDKVADENITSRIYPAEFKGQTVCCSDKLENKVVTARACSDFNRTISLIEAYDPLTKKQKTATLTVNGCTSTYDSGKKTYSSCS